MNMRLACDLCGHQPCLCVEAECKRCDGEGEHIHAFLSNSASEPEYVTCEDCDGSGWIKCDGPRDGGRCKFAPPPGIPSAGYHCYCEAAWERQQEANASEPPMTADERHRQAWEEKQALRSGRNP